MQVFFTLEVSLYVFSKLSFVNDCDLEKDLFFEKRNYGTSIEALYISIACISKGFEEFFQKRPPRYSLGGKRNIEGSTIVYKPRSFMYDVMLDHKVYFKTAEPKPQLASEILDSLKVISEIRAIKDFDVPRFTNDLEFFFKSVHWI
jgi:hypothetical protein